MWMFTLLGISLFFLHLTFLGFRNLHLDDQMTLLQCSWLFLMSFSLGWRSYEQCNGRLLCFAPDLVINKWVSRQGRMLSIYSALFFISAAKLSYNLFLFFPMVLHIHPPSKKKTNFSVYDDKKPTKVGACSHKAICAVPEHAHPTNPGCSCSVSAQHCSRNNHWKASMAQLISYCFNESLING